MTRYWLIASSIAFLVAASVVTLAYRYSPEVGCLLIGVLGTIVALVTAVVLAEVRAAGRKQQIARLELLHALETPREWGR
jgi:predicted anti-sigma-YlaC factor YlaD